MALEKASDPGSTGRLAKKSLLGGDESVGREDLLVCHRVDEALGFVARGDSEVP